MRRLTALIAPLLFAATLLTASPTRAAVPGLDFTATGCEGDSDSVARLYVAGLGRTPDNDGFDFWMVKYTRGEWNLRTMATFFSQSPEFEASYGTLDQDGFIRQLYRNVLGREGEQGGVTYWNGQMSAGMTRGTLLLRFSESPENIARSGTSQPTLGEFNAGRTAPWTCVGWTPPNPGDAVNCPDFATQAEAQSWFDYYYPAYGDIAGLDVDNDLVACEKVPPTWLTINDLSISQGLIAVGLEDDGAMELPGVDEIGWYSHGAVPGRPGATVLVAHVWWGDRPSPFHRLGELELGAQIEVEVEDTVHSYLVVERSLYDKDSLPPSLWRNSGPETLVLITCGGEYDHSRRSYKQNVVVYTTPAG